MRQAITRLVLFLACWLVLDRLLYAGAVFLRDNSGHRQEIDLIYDEGWNPSVAFFGDSRTRHNFDVEEVETSTGLATYDFGRDGISAEEILFMLEEYLRHGHRPRVVVFEADPRLLDLAVGQFFKQDFRDHVAVIPEPGDLLRESQPTLQQRASAFAVAWLARSASLPNRLPVWWRRWRARGQDSRPAAQTFECGPDNSLRCKYYNGGELFMTGPGREIAEEPMPFRIDADRMALFAHVAALAEKEDFWLLLAETPRFHGDEAYPADSKARADAFYCGLAQAHPRVLYARLTHVDGIDRDPSLYFDWTHFNGLGAGKMSRLVAPLIMALARGGRPQPCLLD
jgi:hypothetical protein